MIWCVVIFNNQIVCKQTLKHNGYKYQRTWTLMKWYGKKFYDWCKTNISQESSPGQRVKQYDVVITLMVITLS